MKKIKQKIYYFLKKSQKYTQTDMIYLAKGGFWLSLGQTISTFSSFFLAIAFANLISKETYGLYKYILSIFSILSLSTLSGISISLVKSVSQGYEKSIFQALKTKIKWGTIGGMIGLFLAIYYFLNNNYTLAIASLIMSFFVPFFNSFNIFDALLQGKKLFKISTKYKIISQILSSLFILIVLLITKNLFAILLAFFVSWTTLRLIFLKIALKNFPPNNKATKQTINLGKHLSLINLIANVSAQADSILIFHFLGSTSLSIYCFALAPVIQIRSLFKSINALALPKLSIKDKKEIKKNLLPKILKFAGLMAVIVLCYFLIAPYIYKIFFPQYLKSIKYSQYFALTLLFFPKKIISTLFIAHPNKKALYLSSVLGSTIRLILFTILIPIMGIFGAINAEICSHIFNTFLLVYLFKKF